MKGRTKYKQSNLKENELLYKYIYAYIYICIAVYIYNSIYTYMYIYIYRALFQCSDCYLEQAGLKNMSLVTQWHIFKPEYLSEQKSVWHALFCNPKGDGMCQNACFLFLLSYRPVSFYSGNCPNSLEKTQIVPLVRLLRTREKDKDKRTA